MINQTDKENTNPSASLYEDRLIAYIDILGWKAARNESSRVLFDAVKSIHDIADRHSKSKKQFYSELSGAEVNPMYLGVEVGAFSDNVVISMPVSFGGRILDKTANLCLEVLKRGFLTRGGIVRGQVFHRDGLIFGPGILDAVCMEQNEAVYPRILIRQEVISACSNVVDYKSRFIIRDFLERDVLNPFCFLETAVENNEINKKILSDEVSKISPIVEEHLSADNVSKKVREKWVYFKRTFLSE